VQELIAAGELSPADARQHPERNVVTRALGVDRSVDPDLMPLRIVAGDRFLVCSDGLTSELDPVRIAVALALDDPQAAADELVARALSGQARDNVSVLVVDIVAVRSPEDATDPRPRDRGVTDRRYAGVARGASSIAVIDESSPGPIERSSASVQEDGDV
jgi:protein phosphatase